MEWKNPHKHTVPQHQLQKEKKNTALSKRKKAKEEKHEKILHQNTVLYSNFVPHVKKKVKKRPRELSSFFKKKGHKITPIFTTTFFLGSLRIFLQKN